MDAENRQILGPAILGIEGAEIASLLQVAMTGNLPYTALRDLFMSMDMPMPCVLVSIYRRDSGEDGCARNEKRRSPQPDEGLRAVQRIPIVTV